MLNFCGRQVSQITNRLRFLKLSNAELLRSRHTTNRSEELKHVDTSSKSQHFTNDEMEKFKERKQHFNSNEKLLLVKAKQDPDLFGTLSATQIPYDTGELEEEEKITNPPPMDRKLSTKKYADLIKTYIRKRKIKEAIDVIEVKMLKEDQVKPENYLFSLVLGACGRVGYTKKAFSLYNDMKKRGFEIHASVYTALFNACANSPISGDGLKRAKHLHNIMIEKRYEPNDSNYNAMIKAYGRCGDINSAFALVDEMSAKQIVIKDDTLNFLLQASITDTEAGFRHALLAWRKFVAKGIKPSIFSYNLLLRVVRDCGLGDLEVTKNMLQTILPPNDKFLRLEAGNEVEDNMTPVSENRPNLLAPVPHLGDIMSLSEVTKAEDRLLLLGGASKFLENMSSNNCKPDIKTFTQLLDCQPSSLVAEQELLLTIQKRGVKPDVDFYNMLMKKRSMRFDYDAAKEVLDMIKSSELKPNLMSYGILALGCKSKEQARDMVEELKERGYRLNAEILGAMLQQACYHNNFGYILEVMNLCVSEDISPNNRFLEHLDKFKRKCRNLSKEESSNTKTFQKNFQIFRMRYKSWLSEVTPTEDCHPWQQFQQENATDTKFFREKGTRFKPRHLSRYRKKTSLKQVTLNANVKRKFKNNRKLMQ